MWNVFKFSLVTSSILNCKRANKTILIHVIRWQNIVVRALNHNKTKLDIQYCKNQTYKILDIIKLSMAKFVHTFDNY